MTADDGAVCDFCRKGHLSWRAEEVAFGQASDKGHVRCRVTLQMGICDTCGSKTLEPDADAIFAAAFRREYDKR